jgi:DNA modification methylase
MIRRIVEVSSNPGDLVLDPFMGSGTTAVASAGLGRRFVGFERVPAYLRMAEARLKGPEAA